VHLAPEVSLLTGAFMLFENRRTFDILAQNFGKPRSQFPQIALAFQDLEFPFLQDVPLEVALAARRQGYLANFRVYLRNTWGDITNESHDAEAGEITKAFADRVASEYADLQADWSRIRQDLTLGAVSRGMLAGTSAIVAGNLHWAAGAAGVVGSLASAVDEYRKIAADVSVGKRNPLAVFMQLARKM